MKLQFLGAAGCVTGSCHLLKINDKKVLLDCGLYQGKDEKEKGNENFEFNPKEIDYVILSHAHIDHSGRIPLLYKRGFKGEVICTEATRDLCSVMLPDSGHIMEMEVEWKNRKRIRQGLEPIEPLYTAKLAEISTYLFRSCAYNKWIEVFEGLKVRFRDAGHLLGSSIIELKIKEKDKNEVKLVFSGDLGNKNLPIIKDPTYIDSADYVIMETTYGDRIHEKIENEFEQLVKIIRTTFKRGGNVIIPSFAVGRTQEVLYVLNKYIETEKLKDIEVYVDSPLAHASTKIFEKYSEVYDDEAKKILKSGNNPLYFEGLKFSESPEESARINKIQSGAIVISASGMCEAGRIKHHLKHNLWRKECSIVFVGYQAEGTLGRAILDGAKKVRIFGEEIAVNAEIYALQGLSGHADQSGLLDWIKGFKTKPKEILLVHGDEEARTEFKKLAEANEFKCRIMRSGERYNINDIESKVIQNRKEKIIRLMDTLDDIDEIDKDLLLDKIKKILE
ncbi:MBL fold metallo-hydrolase [Clostridium sp. YIM B02515]|uniref:MBL fold metallo-hydrolase n=1 Tax=Clostridium rhizosphaerae TaxID=2803861 RepID=A0ABS1THD5_9CLOT|nr:MBL fold metallo-hydrolase [Clostridium rhizosphaerae]MBL4938031.1 MBL fold metallo-hydrolase [Clostridium rhizosphaerae]